MALAYSNPFSATMNPGTPAPDFSLKGTDGKTYSLSNFLESKILVVIFMCNHCPYVVAVQGRINALAKAYARKDMQLIGINSNDAKNYPEDSFEEMKTRALEEGYAFPYLFDETQEVAKAYGAVCTPDPYLFERVGKEFKLHYHGRIDDSWKDESQVKQRDLALAIDAVLARKLVHSDQKPSMGCSIKWREKG